MYIFCYIRILVMKVKYVYECAVHFDAKLVEVYSIDYSKILDRKQDFRLCLTSRYMKWITNRSYVSTITYISNVRLFKDSES